MRSIAIACVASALAACGPLGCPVTQTFAIDGAQAARILDAQGNPTLDGCRAVCDQSVGAATQSDGGGDAGVLYTGNPVGCAVISNGRSLEVECHYVLGC
jgi:hypothetical protein